MRESMSVFRSVPTRLRVFLMAGAAMAVPGLAHADWRKAETAHFIVHSNGFERDLRDYAVELERIDQLMRTYFNLPQAEGERRLPVYIVRTRREMAVVEPELPDSTAGFYSANFRDVRAVAVKHAGDETLRHEYGHHFMFRNFPGAYPAWFREGFAEFFSTATVTSSGSATLGKSPFSSIMVLNNFRWLPMEKVLAGEFSYADSRETGAFYAQSWLLMHWTLTDPERRRRMDGYLADTAHGMPSDEALKKHFDMDAEQLGQTLRAYLAAGPRYAELDVGSVEPALTITRLPASADNVLLLDLNARNGGPAQQGPEMLTRARKEVADHPGDAMAQMMLARVELRWGDPAAAEQLVQPLLDADPANVELLLLMADARITAGDKLNDPDARERLYRQARGFLARAYAADPGDNRIYQSVAYSRRFTADYPTENDVELWRRAIALAPEVASNRPVAAEAMLHHGLIDEAERVIQPIANDPHGAEPPERLRRILDRIAAARAGNAPDVPAATSTN